MSPKGFRLTYIPYFLRFRHRFAVAAGSRDKTPVVFTKAEYEGFTGYGEASMPPYLGESHESVMRFLAKVDLGNLKYPFDMEEVTQYLDSLSKGDNAAKAAVDIALHDLIGKIEGRPLYDIFGFNPADTPCTSYTIGIDSPELVKIKVKEAEGFEYLKVKITKGNEFEMVSAIRELSDKPLYIDVNQGWDDKYYALEMINHLKEAGAVLIEQPLPGTMRDEIAWLSENSPLPVLADEGIKTIQDLRSFGDSYSGINIKLMKCGGLHNGLKLLREARQKGLFVMIGCMSETSCGISAAAQLSPAVDWADLDGNLLIAEDYFDGVKIDKGRLILQNKSGLGAVLRDVDFFFQKLK